MHAQVNARNVVPGQQHVPSANQDMYYQKLEINVVKKLQVAKLIMQTAHVIVA